METFGHVWKPWIHSGRLGLSIINHPFWGMRISATPHMVNLGRVEFLISVSLLVSLGFSTFSS